MLIGAHSAGTKPLDEAAERNGDLIQFFLGDPQGWKKPLPRADAAELRAADLPIYIHAPYLINVASANNRIRIPSRKNLQAAADAASEIGAAGLVVHGGHVTDDEDVSEGFPRWRKALDQIETDVPILIENTAGGENAMAREVETIARLWEHVGETGVGFVLDTCHAWAGGEDLETIVERVLAATGRIDLVHCNDSRDPFNSRRDRHANLGQGEIPGELLLGVVKAAGAPVVVETPGEALQHAADISWLREGLAAR
ncbi:MAG: deoxyribonuclease IV [Acidimicrobiia bacterium]|nr:deoxyribonuclease IV [Acidimicrobiia bacterium]MBT8215672.1 deoxyribonuclease IV [Acidimicrobiia bacterium]